MEMNVQRRITLVPMLCVGMHTCAWHDAVAELLANEVGSKPAETGETPAVTGRKGNANKARAVSRNGASGGSMRQNLCT